MDQNELPETAFIVDGPATRVCWMRHAGDFPARRFLEKYPQDFVQFMQRCQEMATFGYIRLWANGHQLKGSTYSALHQFKMNVTRSWGYLDGRTYVVLSAAKKRATGQEPDYDRALALLDDYLTGKTDP